MSQKLQAVRGMNDILPEEAEQWQWFEATVSRCLQAYGYSPIRLPVVEHTALFKRAIGEVTDIVEKEMYAFTDALNGEELTLRPEGTAGCVRAAIEHNLLAQGASHRLWYSGCGTAARCSAMNVRKKGVIASFIRLASKPWGWRDPILTLN